MRDYRNAKAMAQSLRTALGEKSVTISNSECLELVARMLGLRDWNVLSAKIEADRASSTPKAAQTDPKKPTPTFFCSFCGKSQYEVAKLIAGPDVFICDQCVGLCDEVLVDGDLSFAGITREALGPKTIEELFLLKARIARALTATHRVRETISTCKAGGGAADSPQAAFFLRKSPEDQRAYEEQVDSRITVMQRAMLITEEQLAQRR
jgi:hypothetical protein